MGVLVVSSLPQPLVYRISKSERKRLQWEDDVIASALWNKTSQKEL